MCGSKRTYIQEKKIPRPQVEYYKSLQIKYSYYHVFVWSGDMYGSDRSRDSLLRNEYPADS